MENFNYIAACKVDANYKEIFYNDFAKKLLFIWKTYDHRLLYDCNVLIYDYFNSVFKSIELKEEIVEKIGVIDTDRQKIVCEEVFNGAGEDFDVHYFGGGEWPFISVVRDKYFYYYRICR